MQHVEVPPPLLRGPRLPCSPTATSPSILRRGDRRSSRGASSSSVRWGPDEECVVETEYSAPDLSSIVPTRLREGGSSNARGGSLCERDLLILHAWAAPEIQTAWSGNGSSARPRGAKLGHALRSAGSSSRSGSKAKRPRKRQTSERKEPPRELPPGWREETRTPQSGRKYRVYLGPTAGLYAESRNKAWETYERLKRVENGEPEFEEEVGPGKKRRNKRVCLACDFGRKRKCTCGKRAKRW